MARFKFQVIKDVVYIRNGLVKNIQIKLNLMDLKAKVIVLALSAVFVLGVSGCTFGNDSEAGYNSWERDVLMASECGMDGLPCCKEKEPSCQYGQSCCRDPRNQERTYCADSCECGKKNAFCCEDDPACGYGLACANHRCVDCGGRDEPVCAEEDNRCEDGLVAHKGKCVECGRAGNPCCRTGAECKDQESINEQHTECRNGVCIECGTHGNPACKHEGCLDGHLSNGGMCFLCGGLNEACCKDEFTDNKGCNPLKGLYCEKGFCSTGG